MSKKLTMAKKMPLKISIFLLLLGSTIPFSPAANAFADECGNYDADKVLEKMLEASRLQQKTLTKYQAHVWMAVTHNKKYLNTYEGEKTYSAENGLTYFPNPHCGFNFDMFKQSVSRAASEDANLTTKINTEILSGRPNPIEFSSDNYSEIIPKGCEVVDGVPTVKFLVTAKRNDKGLFDGSIWINPKTNQLVKSAGDLKGTPALVKSAKYEAQYAAIDGFASMPVKVTTKVVIKGFGSYDLTQTLKYPGATTTDNVSAANASTSTTSPTLAGQTAHR